MLIWHDPASAEYWRPGAVERPARVTATAAALRANHPEWEWRRPEAALDELLLLAHSAAHLKNLRNPAGDFDADSPAHPGIFGYAAQAAGAAVAVVRAARAGERAFSLMRPPGHHACRERAMGFCYLNHIAVAALTALEEGAARVAIWDFDAHHGNGTEELVAGNERIGFASVHQFPAYPGTGTTSFGNVRNYPVAPMSARGVHRRAVEESLGALVKFQPEVLLVSAGFDAFVRDPITQMTLEAEDFATFGRWLRETGLPAGAILEGGYSDELPELVDVFLSAWDG